MRYVALRAMPSRILREGILSSERVDALASWGSECFYRRLMSVVDDFGRYYANPSLLRAACYPLKLDKVSNADVEKWLAECAGAALVSTYECGGKRYLQMHDFRQQERAKTSRFPSPDGQPPDGCDAPAQHPLTDVHLDEGEVVDVIGGEGGKARASTRRPSRKTPIPKDFSLSTRVQTWAAEKGHDRLDEHLESFVSKAKAKGYTYVDWDEALMNAIRDDWAGLRKANGSGPGRRGSVIEHNEALRAKLRAERAQEAKS